VICNINNYSAYNNFSFSYVPQNQTFTLTMTAPGEQAWKGTVRMDRKNQGPMTLEGTTGPSGTGTTWQKKPDL
jgi:hypothetical protein